MARKNIPSGGEFEDVHGYSRAVRVGEQVHVAGTCAQPPHDHGDAYEQTRGALGIIEKALIEAGSGFADVVRTVIYVTDMELHANGVTKAHGEMFGDIRPASTLVAVSGLLRPELFVEIEVYAIVEDG